MAAAIAAFVLYQTITMAGRRRRKRGVEVDDDESGSLLSDLLWLGKISTQIHCIHNNHCMKSRLGVTCVAACYIHKMSIILQNLNNS